MTEQSLEAIWVYLSATPLLGLTVTLLAYNLAHRLYVLSQRNPLLNPVLTAVALLIGLLWATDMSYQDYFTGAQFVHFLLGPATVALAIPLYQQLANLRQLWLPALVALVIGVSVGGGSAVLLAWHFGADEQTLLSLAPKSVTAPVAMGISEGLGGLPSLTAVFVVTTGVIGAVLGTKLFDVLKIKHDSVRGIALGVAAHGIGTARAFQVSSQMGAFAGLAMALSAFIASLVLPYFTPLLIQALN